jgi:hypothetical protein
VLALPERSQPLPAGSVTQLVLVVRNDGDLASAMTRLLGVFPAGWTVQGASVSRGLVSTELGAVRASLGRVQPDEQVIITILVQAPRVAVSNAQHCITLEDDLLVVQRICAPLPEVLAAGVANVPLAARPAAAAATGARPTLILLNDIADELGSGKLGASLLVGNEGNALLAQANLSVEMTGDWRLSDLSTTQGVVSAVDYRPWQQNVTVVRLGRLAPGALVAVTLRGRPLGGEQAPFCATLSSGDQPLQRVCGALTAAPARARASALHLAGAADRSLLAARGAQFV